MPLKGINPDQYFPYVPECEKGADQPTTFWLRIKTVADKNRSVAKYTRAIKENARTGEREINAVKWSAVDEEDFLSICNKVENFIFESDVAENKITAVIEDIEGRKRVWRELPSDVGDEVLLAATNYGKLTEAEKKD